MKMILNRIATKNTEEIKQVLKQLDFQKPDSHKGQNGRVLVVGGSPLFHAASIWSAEVASHFADIVHYSSTEENNQIFTEMKKKFHNGIVVARKDIDTYAEEDDAVLIGPGMMREGSDGKLTHDLTHHLITSFPHKKFVFDAGALQMMKPEWLLELKEKAVVTPHQIEFRRLFGISVAEKNIEEKIEIVSSTARKFNTIILLKAVVDIISDGEQTYVIEGGNQGLSKGGTGDMLAGLTLALVAKNPQLFSAASASILLKRSADELYDQYGYWYNIGNLIEKIPQTLKKLLYN